MEDHCVAPWIATKLCDMPQTQVFSFFCHWWCLWFFKSSFKRLLYLHLGPDPRAASSCLRIHSQCPIGFFIGLCLPTPNSWWGLFSCFPTRFACSLSNIQWLHGARFDIERDLRSHAVQSKSRSRFGQFWRYDLCRSRRTADAGPSLWLIRRIATSSGHSWN